MSFEKLNNQLDSLQTFFKDKVAEIEGKVSDSGELKKKTDEELQKVRAALDEQKEKMAALSRNSLPGVNEERDKFSFHKAYRGILNNDWNDAGFEKEVFDNMYSKAANASDGSSGAYMIPTELADQIVEPALAAMPLWGLGITVINGVRGTFEIPVLETRGEGSHVGENDELSEVSYTWGQKRMTPHRAGGFTKISKRLINQTGGGAENFIRNQLIKSLAVTLHKAGVNGKGTEDEIKGILNTSGFTSHTDIDAQATIKHLFQMKTDLEEADFDLEMGKFGYLTRPIVVEGVALHRTSYFSGQTSGKGFALPMPILDRGDIEKRIGSKIATTTHVPTSGSGSSKTTSLVYGDWSHVVLALWAGMSLDVSMQASDSDGNSAWLKNQVWIKAEQEYDMVIDLPAAFIKDDTVKADRSGFDQY